MIKNIDREQLVYNSDKYKYNFRKFKITKTFSRDNYESKIRLKEANDEQSDLAIEIDKFIK